MNVAPNDAYLELDLRRHFSDHARVIDSRRPRLKRSARPPLRPANVEIICLVGIALGVRDVMGGLGP